MNLKTLLISFNLQPTPRLCYNVNTMNIKAIYVQINVVLALCELILARLAEYRFIEVTYVVLAFVFIAMAVQGLISILKEIKNKNY